MASSAESITIDKDYFDVLLRRTGFSSSSHSNVFSQQGCITLPKADYDILMRLSQEYAALRQALNQGGTNNQDLDLLIKNQLNQHFSWGIYARANHSNWLPSLPSRHELGGRLTELHIRHNELVLQRAENISEGTEPTQSVPNSFMLMAPMINPPPSPTPAVLYKNYSLIDADNRDSPDFEDSDGEWEQVMGKTLAPSEKRSLVFKNLPPGVKLFEIFDVLCGGVVVDVYVGTNDHHATITFAEFSVAKAFLDWATRSVLKIRGYPIFVAFAEKAWKVPKHIAKRIEHGATRNILVKGMGADFDENQIRDDLDHIHNLVVVETYRPTNGNGIVISTNAIHLALFAKTCMRSRALYKKAHLSFYPDKCAIKEIPQTNFNPRSKALADKTNGKKVENKVSLANRFDLLNLSDPDDDSSLETSAENSWAT